MISLPIVVASTAGVSASLIARRLVVGCQAAFGGRGLLLQIVGDIRKLAAGTDTSSFLTEYVQLLRRLGWLVVVQLVMLSINLVTMAVVYALSCWPLDFGSAAQATNPLGQWLSDVEWSFLLAAAVSSLFAPFVFRTPA